jgi:hypothetical protein
VKRIHVFMGALVLAGCGRAARPAATDEPGAPFPASCAGELPSFAREVRPLVERYCFECHARGGSATEEHDFEHFDTLFAQRHRVAGVLTAHAMPPGSASQPSEPERAMLARWASCSRPE